MGTECLHVLSLFWQNHAVVARVGARGVPLNMFVSLLTLEPNKWNKSSVASLFFSTYPLRLRGTGILPTILGNYSQRPKGCDWVSASSVLPTWVRPLIFPIPITIPFLPLFTFFPLSNPIHDAESHKKWRISRNSCLRRGQGERTNRTNKK